jgi:lysophospholipase L1-like esterase
VSSPTIVLLLLCGTVLSACQRSSKPGKETTQPATSQEPTQALEPVTNSPSHVHDAENNAPAHAAEPDVASAAKKRYVVAALGDSITDARVGGGGYLKVLREKCPQSVFLNFGKGGDMTNQMRRRFELDIRPQVSAQQINTLLVYGGVNDLYSDLTADRKNERIEEDLSSIYRQAKASGLKVVAVTVSPWGGFAKYWNPRRGQNTKLLNSWIMGQVANGLIDKAVDSYAPLSCGDPEVLCAQYETRSHDGLHPGAEGHTILGQKLAQEAFADCL